MTTRSRSAGSRGGSSHAFLVLLATLGGLVAFFLLEGIITNHPYYGPRAATGYTYWYLVAAGFAPYAWAIHAYRQGARPSMRLLWVGAIVLYVALIPAPALQSQDLYQNLFYGKMALEGHNPYVINAASLQDPWRAWTHWDTTLSLYGPAWTILTAGIVKVSGGHLTTAFLLLKGVTAAFALGAAWALTRVANAQGGRRGGGTAGIGSDPRFAVLAFAFDPMVLFSVGLGAHSDIAVGTAVAWAILAERRGHDRATTVLLGLASLVKVYAAFILVAWLVCLARRHGARTVVANALSVAALAALTYLPFWEGSRTFGGVAQIGRAASTSLVGTVIRLASGHPSDAFAAGSSPAGTVARTVVILLLVIALVAVGRSPRTRDEPWRAGALLFGAYVLLTPWYLYWHLIALVALACVVSDRAIARGTLTFSGTSLFVGSGGVAAGLALQAVIRYAPPVAVAVSWSRSRRPLVTSRGSL
jgi:glycosyl transferase family 87